MGCPLVNLEFPVRALGPAVARKRAAFVGPWNFSVGKERSVYRVADVF